MNKKNDKVIRLSKEGLDPRLIARKLGYKGSSMPKGIEIVKRILKDNEKSV